MNKEIVGFFLYLVRLGIGTEANLNNNDNHNLSEGMDWEELKTIAADQGLLAVVLDGLDRQNAGGVVVDMPKKVRLEWIGEVLQQEQQYAVQQKAASEVALLLHHNGIRTYVLKGEVVSECYPRPEHRVSVDMDCFLTEEAGFKFQDSSSKSEATPETWSLKPETIWERGNKVIEDAGFKVGRGFYKNSSFYLPGLHVENHQFLTPFRGNKRLKSLERLLQRLINDNHNDNRFDGTWLYRPPVMVSALFLIEHAYSHFLHEGLTWRHVLDWAMFSRKHKEEIDWASFNGYLDEFGFKKFYDSFSQLGLYLIGEFQDSSFRIQEERMLADIWASLDLHETLHGVKAKFQLAGNYWRARWKYKYFTDMTWIRALMEWVLGAVIDRHPKLD